jgi:hypothetical protein
MARLILQPDPLFVRLSQMTSLSEGTVLTRPIEYEGWYGE